MPTKRRKFEIHKLTISGLVDGSDYRRVIRDCRHRLGDLERAIWDHGGKTHALEEVHLHGENLRLKFLSYKTGYRPDILDTSEFKIEPTPLTENLTGVDYTHALLSKDTEDGKWRLIVEKTQGGIWPNTLGKYLNWMIDKAGPPADLQIRGQEIFVSVEPEPGEQFIHRIEELDRITKATLRIVRPNPGWMDLESELGDEAGASNASRADVTMAAKRGSTLKKNGGIIGRIKALFRDGSLGHSAITGVRNGTEDTFTTEQLGQKEYRPVATDERGQVKSSDAYGEMAKMVQQQGDGQ